MLIDGNRSISYNQMSYSCHIKSNAIFASIMAPSILAKTSRDEHIKNIHEKFPQPLGKNKRYPT
ncbi:ribonuclease H family protein [Bacteroidetes bacterium endosymbiont of Geopemphigus sp.]|uniref:hypothetical protein n=1 Tax=Bacteroidetes bacterium endosymbiont of Geopemphigus sp. TaxID=2047937 RepID=UPI0039773654